VGSKRIGQVRFRAISREHGGATVPHLHADIGSGEVLIEFLAGGAVGLSKAHGDPIRGRVTARELRIVLETACSAYDELLALWKASQPR